MHALVLAMLAGVIIGGYEVERRTVPQVCCDFNIDRPVIYQNKMVCAKVAGKDECGWKEWVMCVPDEGSDPPTMTCYWRKGQYGSGSTYNPFLPQ
jgi:hypothetical protein